MHIGYRPTFAGAFIAGHCSGEFPSSQRMTLYTCMAPGHGSRPGEPPPRTIFGVRDRILRLQGRFTILDLFVGNDSDFKESV